MPRTKLCMRAMSLAHTLIAAWTWLEVPRLEFKVFQSFAHRIGDVVFFEFVIRVTSRPGAELALEHLQLAPLTD